MYVYVIDLFVTIKCQWNRSVKLTLGTVFKPGEGRRAPDFLKLCVCVSAPEAINYIHVILNQYNQLNKFVTFET